MEIIDPEDLTRTIQDALNEFGDLAVSATDEALIEGATVLVKALKRASPVKTGRYKKGWRINKKPKLKKYVRNTTTEDGKNGSVPLSNVLEYSETKGDPFIAKTFESTVDDIALAIIQAIEENL